MSRICSRKRVSSVLNKSLMGLRVQERQSTTKRMALRLKVLCLLRATISTMVCLSRKAQSSMLSSLRSLRCTKTIIEWFSRL